MPPVLPVSVHRRVQSALGFFCACPTPGAFVLSCHDGARAGLAADTGISLVVQGIIRNAVMKDSAPHVALGPRRQGTDFDHSKLSVPTNDWRIRARRTLVAANSRCPCIKMPRHSPEDTDLSIVAAFVGISLVNRTAVKSFIGRDRQLGPLKIDADPIFLDNAIAKFERLSKLIARVEIEDIDAWINPREHRDDDTTFWSETGGHCESGGKRLDGPRENLLGSGIFQKDVLSLNPFQRRFGKGAIARSLGSDRLARGWVPSRESRDSLLGNQVAHWHYTLLGVCFERRWPL